MESKPTREACRRDAAFRLALQRIVSDEVTRRELLWYRAMETGDELSARYYEECPGVRERVLDAEAVARSEDSEPDDPRAARERYGRLFTERLERHLGGVGDVPCDCRRCRSRGPGSAGEATSWAP